MRNAISSDLETLFDFLRTPTPIAWLEAARDNIALLLLDHAHCERKAAATAVNFMSKYPAHKSLIDVMSPLAREELLHFEKVIALMEERELPFGPLTPSNYALKLHALVAKHNGKERLRDQLLVGALIEARSAERFHALIPYLPDDMLVRFYTTLVKSEVRHFQDYLRLAQEYGGDINERLADFLDRENQLIAEQDTVFRFHSGVPTAMNA